jgi:hypothetical protein
MALDPNISLGVKPLELANPLAQYGQIAAIQNAQNQNQLAQFQLGAARRQEESQNVLADVYKRSLNPETGAIDSQALIRNLAGSNAAYLIPDVQTKLLATEKERGLIKKTGIETEEKEFKLKNDKLNFAWNAVGSASTPQDAIQKITEGVRSGVFDMKGASADIQQLQNMTPEQYQQYRVQKVMGILDAKDKLGFMLPKTRDRDIGGMIQTIQDNPALPGYGLPVAGMAAIPKTQTFADRNAAARLAFDQNKFAWEQANPGYELKEAEDGSIVGVNKRTLQAFPVSIGGAAPAVAQPAPMAGAGMPGARMPVATTVPAIPGMTSVLDQQVPATAPAAGTPLRGKGTALTESQGNATAYGMRMKEANAILEPLENAGKTNTGLIKGVVSGAVGLVPFIGDKLEDASGSIFNALPRVLGGLSPEQQQVAQARINFITAILRKESGAAIGASEFATAEKNYFPKPGDDAAAIAQKQAARKTAIKAMEIQAGPGAKQMVGAGVVPGATANNPLGLPGL